MLGTVVLEHPAQIADPNVGGWLADPDHDGVPNWLAFVCDAAPLGGATAVDRSALPQAGFENVGNTNYVTLTYRRDPLATQTNLSYETSSDLAAGAWQATAPDVVETLTPDPVTGDPRIRAKFVATGSKKFVRLRVTGP